MAIGVNDKTIFTSNLNTDPDLVKTYLFQVKFMPTSDALKKLIANDEETLMLRARSVTIPKKETHKISTEYMGSKKNYPGKTVMDGDCTIEFDEFQDLKVSEIMQAWQGIMYNHYTQYGSDPQNIINNSIAGGAFSDYTVDYSCDIKIQLYDSTCKNLLPYVWILHGCWPTSVGEATLNAEGEDKMKRSVTFNFDTWEMMSTGQGPQHSGV